MAVKNGKQLIEFPPMDAQEEVKLKQLLSHMGELMGVEFQTELVTIYRVSFPIDRKDVSTVLSRISGARKKRK